MGGVLERQALVDARQMKRGQNATPNASEKRQADGDGKRKRINRCALQQWHTERLQPCESVRRKDGQ
jgi:hypothetical protein